MPYVEVEPDIFVVIEEWVELVDRGEIGRVVVEADMDAVLLGKRREAEASALAAEAVKLDDTPAMRLALVEKAVGARQARPGQLNLLDQAEKAGADVQELRKLVGTPPK